MDSAAVFHEGGSERERELLEQLHLCREYDQLTGLYNREFFCKKTAERLSGDPAELQIVCIDIQGFKLINDLYGLEHGDEVLRELAQGLRDAFPECGGLIARLYNDLFAMCVPQMAIEELERRISALFSALSVDVKLTPAVGVCLVTDNSVSVSRLCDWAMMALTSIKGNYRTHISTYDSGLRTHFLKEQEIVTQAEAALANREFEVYYQPKYNMITGKVVGAEALVRWNKPGKGIISPGEFIPVFEHNGFIKELDRYVWETTASQMDAWIRKGYAPLPVSVNVSRLDTFDDDLCSIMEDLLQRHSLAAAHFQLEITESAFVSRPEEVTNTMTDLHKVGFTILMDDFGSGYSSLNMLKDLNVDVLKLDMRFLDRTDRRSRDIVESVVRMCRWLDVSVIAEGVENLDQVNFLLKIGCIYAQGFYYSKPIPAQKMEEILSAGDNLDTSDSSNTFFLDVRDLFHGDAIDDQVLANILGAVAIYSFDGERLHMCRGNGDYYRLTGRVEQTDWCEVDLLSVLAKEDLPVVLEVLHDVYEGRRDSAHIHIRMMCKGALTWVDIKLFHLSKSDQKEFMFVALNDLSAFVETLGKRKKEQGGIGETG